MYSYHNTIKKRIKNGELTSWEFVDDYPNIGPCLLLKFNTHPPVRPIRLHRALEYLKLLTEQDNKA